MDSGFFAQCNPVHGASSCTPTITVTGRVHLDNINNSTRKLQPDWEED